MACAVGIYEKNKCVARRGGPATYTFPSVQFVIFVLWSAPHTVHGLQTGFAMLAEMSCQAVSKFTRRACGSGKMKVDHCQNSQSSGHTLTRNQSSYRNVGEFG